MSNVAHGARKDADDVASKVKKCAYEAQKSCVVPKLKLQVCMLTEAVKKLDEELIPSNKMSDLGCSSIEKMEKKVRECVATVRYVCEYRRLLRFGYPSSPLYGLGHQYVR